MKILYGIQATGNGHLSRAIELLPHIQKHAEIDLLVSGTESSINFPYDILYKKKGLSIYFGKKGNLDIFKSVSNFNPVSLIKDITGCPVTHYDIVISDFEPISAWSAKIKNVPSISVSHQAAFHSLKAPRPKSKNRFAEFILKNYAPTDNYLGFHFQEYDQDIFLPLIRETIRNIVPEKGDHNVVYLPAYSPLYLINFLRKFKDTKWKVFSKYTNRYIKSQNVEVFPTSHSFWIESLRSCKGVLIGAGFEGPSEVLHLGKKMMVVPMKGQYEQLCNAMQ